MALLCVLIYAQSLFRLRRKQRYLFTFSPPVLFLWVSAYMIFKRKSRRTELLDSDFEKFCTKIILERLAQNSFLFSICCKRLKKISRTSFRQRPVMLLPKAQTEVSSKGLENRCVLRHISNMNFLSWAVLGSRGCREKKNPHCHKYATFEASFSCFHGQKES